MATEMEEIERLHNLRSPGPAAREFGWLNGHDVGTSSLTIFSVLSAAHGAYALARRDPSPPWDPADFGRCHRLLLIVPEWRPQLHRVAAIYPQWAPLVREWDGLTALFQEEEPTGRAPKLYVWMKYLLAEGGAYDSCQPSIKREFLRLVEPGAVIYGQVWRNCRSGAELTISSVSPESVKVRGKRAATYPLGEFTLKFHRVAPPPANCPRCYA